MNCNSDDRQYSLVTLDQRREELLSSKLHKKDDYYKIACLMVDSGKYDEAIKYCKLQLRAYRSLQNKVNLLCVKYLLYINCIYTYVG